MLLSHGIGAHDAERTFGRQLLVPGARRQNDHFAGPRGHYDAVVAAELNHHFTAVDAERLVRIAMKMMERIDAVAPCGGPMIAIE